MFLLLLLVALVNASLVYDSRVMKLNAYNESNAIHFARLCSVSYCKHDHIEQWSCSPCSFITKPKHLHIIADAKEYFQGLVGYSNDRIIVAFRGSMDVKNWLDNLTFTKTQPWKNHPNVYVHQGFFWVYESIGKELITALNQVRKEYPKAPIVMTGHSLGAAIAAIATIDLHEQYNISIEQLVTFGEPRVGTKGFVEYLLKTVPYLARITHWRDLVPHVPFRWLGYLHGAQEIWYSEDSSVYKLCDPHDGEDARCNNQFRTTASIADHLVYLNISMSHLLC
ncbi:lipase [Thraustotheca clavata]|uniref:Lipase n=1 Tax=Thraustotheca clavata TaxID=74557 RepID=A0A1V9ZRM8_9STRA|nr:lipase [Thraustotheca clavata]